MSAEEYLEMADNYRRAKEAAPDDFTRYFLERMERGYRVLATSKAVLDRPQNVQGPIDRPSGSDPAKT
ncbi:hypothetical protein H8B02_46010 [Bradyrhizobium sp. Pear77]|uniref:hypothetical protein n=1 Tax=Bradyrhizobium altum TaxID=1571202 RepID=UPI001E4A263D|nr:hypothetical protein [Bradyrhizobium altum]MCC8960501.1 hypothetical protein [Bradyrhizobium altum]